MEKEDQRSSERGLSRSHQAPQDRSTPVRSIEDDGGALLDAAVSVAREQQAALESATIEQAYKDALDGYVQAKHDQVTTIENRLALLRDRAEDRLHQLQAQQPGLLSTRATKQSWAMQCVQQRRRVQTLTQRLDTVRDIADGMGVHSPRIDALAARKLRAEHPELASDWDAMRAAKRVKQLAQRKSAPTRDMIQAVGPRQAVSVS